MRRQTASAADDPEIACEVMTMLPAVTLQNSHVVLEPLEERHREGLRLAGSAPGIWTLQPFNIHEGFDRYFDWIIEERRSERWLPFAVKTPSGEIVGQSCYLEFRAVDRSVEIGGTWYAPSAQGTRVNPAAKLLLLDHAFANDLVRVQLKTDVRNATSRAAISKLGAQMEGIHRKHRRLPDGTWRDSVYFSLLDTEWAAAKSRLEERLIT